MLQVTLSCEFTYFNYPFMYLQTNLTYQVNCNGLVKYIDYFVSLITRPNVLYFHLQTIVGISIIVSDRPSVLFWWTKLKDNACIKFT